MTLNRHQTPGSTRAVNPTRPPLPPKELPVELRDVVVAAYRRRVELAAASADHAAVLRPMWELAATLCDVVHVLAVEPGEVAIRLCDLPVDATADQVWARVRTSARADMWEYSCEHHHCVRVADWRPWAA